MTRIYTQVLEAPVSGQTTEIRLRADATPLLLRFDDLRGTLEIVCSGVADAKEDADAYQLLVLREGDETGYPGDSHFQGFDHYGSWKWPNGTVDHGFLKVGAAKPVKAAKKKAAK